jgi:hypothetical protein
VGEEALAGIGGQREGLKRQFQVPDDRVVQALHADVIPVPVSDCIITERGR